MTFNYDHANGSGVLLKRVTSGYTWSIAVDADGSDKDDLIRATQIAMEVDLKLRMEYGAPVK